MNVLDPPKSKSKLWKAFSLLALFGILMAIPLTVVILGQRTRQQIKADISCSKPAIPDPKDCLGGRGVWNLYTDEDECVKFRCEPR